MQRLKRFFVRVKESIYSKEWYSKLQTVPFRYSLKYYLVLVFFAAGISALFFSSIATPSLVKGFKELITQESIRSYPQDLVVSVKDGMATSSQTTPFIIPYTPSDGKDKAMHPDIQNMLVVDTSGVADLAKFRDYHTVALLSSDAFVIYSGDGPNAQIRVYPLSTFPNTTISKENIEKVITGVSKFLWLLWPALLVLGCIGFYVVYLFSFFQFLFVALVVWGLFGLMKLKIGYKKSYQYVLHAVTLPTLFMLFSVFLPVWITFQGMTVVLVLIVVYVNMRTTTPSTVETPPIQKENTPPVITE